ncbi:MAG: DEAD/DEAH box helicase [Acidimicrobiales bacterium]
MTTIAPIDAPSQLDPPRAETQTFASLGLPPDLIRLLDSRQITSPLPIQSATIADVLEGRDVCGKAPTGSGKTLAFALPIVATVNKGRAKSPRALILAPTRELAAQIAKEIVSLSGARRLRVHSFYGGVGFGPQLKALRDGIDIAVACPGRLEDLMSSGSMRLGEVETVVVDEADRMADMGFLPAVKRILDATSSDRQTLLFSATLDGDVDELVRRYQRHPVRHSVEADVDELARMTHRFQGVAHDDRSALCAQLVSEHDSTVVFVRTRHGAERLARQLERSGVRAVAIHGDRSQRQRDRALAEFRSGHARALVATDVAARGIHIDEVGCVIHFDLAADAKDYVHRSGRTARAGSSGTVVSLVTPEQANAAQVLRRDLKLDGAELVGLVDRPVRRDRPARQGRPQARGAGQFRGAGQPRSTGQARTVGQGRSSEQPRSGEPHRGRASQPRRGGSGGRSMGQRGSAR